VFRKSSLLRDSELQNNAWNYDKGATDHTMLLPLRSHDAVNILTIIQISAHHTFPSTPSLLRYERVDYHSRVFTENTHNESILTNNTTFPPISVADL